MKRFLTYTGLLLVLVLVLQFIGEYVYTYVYNHGSYRNKVMWVRGLEKETKLDYAILGSSRVNYHLDPTIIEKKTRAVGINLGLNNSYASDKLLMLEELLEKTHPKRVFVQVDYTFDKTGPNPVGSVSWMPYLKEERIFNHFSETEGNYTLYKNWPFYRYQIFESQLGIRNITMSLLGKQPNFLEREGFVPLRRNFNEASAFSHRLKDVENESYAAIQAICKEKGIDLYFFTAPLNGFQGNFKILEKYLPNYTDFSKAISEDHYFADEVHLKEAGAILFTELFVDTYFNNK